MKIFRQLLPTILMLLFEVAAGVMLLIDGEHFTQIIFIIFGVILLISGLIMLIRSLFASRKGGSIPMGLLILSILFLGIGAFFAAASGSVESVFSTVTLVFGIILAFSGMLNLAEYLSLRRGGAVSIMAVILAILTIVLGIVIAFNPFGTAQLMWIMMGIFIIISAFFDLISLILFAIALKNMPDTMIEVEVNEVDESV